METLMPSRSSGSFDFQKERQPCCNLEHLKSSRRAHRLFSYRLYFDSEIKIVFLQAMGDQDPPGVLVSGFEGPSGICTDHVGELQKHFPLITTHDFWRIKHDWVQRSGTESQLLLRGSCRACPPGDYCQPRSWSRPSGPAAHRKFWRESGQHTTGCFQSHG